MQYEITRSKHEHILHTTLHKSLKKHRNRYHPSSAQRLGDAHRKPLFLLINQAYIEDLTRSHLVSFWHIWAYTSPSVVLRTTKILPRTTEMGSIVERKRKDGTVSYRAQILIKSKGRIVHQESSSFDRLTTAKAWLKRRDKELEAPGGLDAARRKSGSVGDVIDDYLKSTGGDIGRTKAQVLRKIREEFAISDIPCDELRPRDITDFARTLSKGRSPSTVQNYLSHLSAVLSIARTAWDYDMNRDVAQDGITAARHLKLAGKSQSRNRRPTLDEIDRLLAYFMETHTRDKRSLPMHIPPVSGMLSAALLFLYFSGGRDRMMIWDIHRNENRLC